MGHGLCRMKGIGRVLVNLKPPRRQRSSMSWRGSPTLHWSAPPRPQAPASQQRTPALPNFTGECIGYTGNLLNQWEGWRTMLGKSACSEGSWCQNHSPSHATGSPTQMSSAAAGRNGTEPPSCPHQCVGSDPLCCFALSTQPQCPMQEEAECVCLLQGARGVEGRGRGAAGYARGLDTPLWDEEQCQVLRRSPHLEPQATAAPTEDLLHPGWCFCPGSPHAGDGLSGSTVLCSEYVLASGTPSASFFMVMHLESRWERTRDRHESRRVFPLVYNCVVVYFFQFSPSLLHIFCSSFVWYVPSLDCCLPCCWIDSSVIVQCPFLSQIFFALKSTLSDINIVIPAFL